MSELQALCLVEEYVSFFPDRVELCHMEGFVPKGTLSTHLASTLALSIFPDPQTGSLHELVICRVLRAYLGATASIRALNRLFIILLFPGARTRKRKPPPESELPGS